MNIPNNEIVTPCSEMLTLKVITNPNLLENILNHLPDGLMKNLNLRLINKQFSNTFIRMIKNSHRQIEIEYIGNDERQHEYMAFIHGMDIIQKDIKTFCVYINYQLVNLAFVDSYVRFIKEFADVKVERVITKNLWKLPESCRKLIHDSITSTLIGDNDVKTLIGIEDICYGCTFCYHIVKRCPEYGPANALVLESFHKFRTRCHFNKLIVFDHTLMTIANNCIRNMQFRPRRAYDRMLNLYVNSFITCEKLVIWISEWLNGVHNLPREVLDLMLKKWNIKRIEIKFIFKNTYMLLREKPESGPSTGFRFNDPYGSVGASNMNFKFDQVDIDLSESFYCAGDINYERLKSNGYENIIANVRRIFPTDKIFIQFSPDYYNNGGAIHTNIDSLLKVASKGIQRDLRIDVRLFTKIETFKFHNPISDKIELSVIPSNIYINSKELHCSVGESSIHCYRRRLEENRNEKFIGKQCRIVDSERNFVLNIDIFIKENDQSYEFSEEQLKEQPDAFVKHFLPSSHS